MLTRIHLSVLLVLAVIVWGGSLRVLGIPISWEYFKPYTITLTILTAGVVLFDRWLWKWFIFRGWFVNQPNLKGTWQVKLVSNYRDPATDEPIDPIDAVMVVRQTFSELSMRLLTRESSSKLVASNLIANSDGTFDIVGVYQNEPQILLRGARSEIHFGALKLELHEERAESLKGHYWTDRETKGSITLSNRKKELVSSYAEAADLFGFAG